MIRSIYTAATGMEAQQLYMDTISNNLANVNTTGFKRTKAEFQDLMYQTLREPGTRNVEGGSSRNKGRQPSRKAVEIQARSRPCTTVASTSS